MAGITQFFGLDTSLPEDDRVLPVTRWLGRVIIPILAVAFAILFIVPDRTEEFFAWTIQPDMTPIFMGAGYGTGAYFFYRVATVDEFHRVSHVFPGITAFVWFMGVATFLHWENFNHDHVSFLAWTFLYVVSPVLVPAIWILNRRTDPKVLGPDIVRIPRVIRGISGVTGIALTVASLALFIEPQPLIDHWPWAVSPLTSRVLLGWFVLFGLTNLFVAIDERWAAARIVAETQLIAFGLFIIGAFRAWDDFDTANPVTWVFLAGFLLYLIALAVVYYAMETGRIRG